MVPLRPYLTPVRRAIGLAAVLFLVISAAVFYRAASDNSISGFTPSTTTNSYTSPTPTSVGAESATPSGLSSSASPSRASDPTPTSTTTRGAGDSTGSGSPEGEAIQVEHPAGSAKPFQTVQIRGTYRGGADTLLQVQRWERHRWLAFPLPAKTDQSGEFTAYVELGRPGLYWLRVQDPDSHVHSKPFLLVIKG